MGLSIEKREFLNWFEKINTIPRCSENEKDLSNFLLKFAKERNLEVIQDDLNNIIIKKSASKGYEDAATVIIQGHMDMVCIKKDDSDHNFEKDPIKMQVDGDYLYGIGTSLGADNGIAVAYALTILDGDYIHPDLEVVITTSEETTMAGAPSLKKDMLKGEILLN